MSTVQTAHPTNKAKLVVFWLYVMIPLVWGVFNTLSQAMKLFK
ncbi:MFS transporter small subunit [Paraburkholderia sp. ZP32-5]|nr:oxalate:formate antiporter [Paraburkholderia sp. ZP32-5]